MAGTLSRRETSPRRFGEVGWPLGSLRSMDDLFESFFGAPAAHDEGAVGLVPRVDVSESEDAVHVTTDLPGWKAEEIDIEINDNVLTLRGERSEETKSEGDNGRKYHRVERRSGSFARAVRLPCAVEERAVDAALADGVLTIALPKCEEAKPCKVAIRS